MLDFDVLGKEGKKKERPCEIYCSGGYGGPLVIILLIQLVGGYAQSPTPQLACFSLLDIFVRYQG